MSNYTFNDWVKYAVHNEKSIKGFFGPFRWLSNFHKCDIWFEGLLYPSSENAFQAAKVEKLDRPCFQTCSAAESKKLWKKCVTIYSAEEWNLVKYDIMSVILFDKFYRNKDLRQKLIDTCNVFLEETNHWGDTDWGVDINKGGKNNLGKILMGIRYYWQNLTWQS